MANYDEVMKRAEGHYGKPLPGTKSTAPPKPIAPKPPAAPGAKSLKKAAPKPETTYKERTRTEQQLEPGMRPGYKNLVKGPSSWKGDYFQGGSRGSK